MGFWSSRPPCSLKAAVGLMVNSHQRRKTGQSGVRKWRKKGFPRVTRGGVGYVKAREEA